MRRPRRISRLCALIGMAGCRYAASSPSQFEFTAPGQPSGQSRNAAAPSILSAHIDADDAAALGGNDAVAVVFSADIDAASLVPHHFLVTLPDGSQQYPEQAVLAPANEDDENRTVWLTGQFGSLARPPTNVAVIGSLFAEDGRTLAGLAAEVTNPSQAIAVVDATQLLPIADRCSGATQVLRTYWTRSLRGVDVSDLSRILVTLADGQTTEPIGFDDHDTGGAQSRQDNVLDLCIDQAPPITALRIAAETFSDPLGQANGEIMVDVAPTPPGE